MVGHTDIQETLRGDMINALRTSLLLSVLLQPRLQFHQTRQRVDVFEFRNKPMEVVQNVPW